VACTKERNHFDYKIVVGDASDLDEVVHSNKESVKKSARCVDIEYFNHPKLGLVETHKKMSSLVKTKYCLTISDAAVVINGGVQECIKYLEENEDAAAAHGDAISFTTTNDLISVDSVKKIEAIGSTPFRALLDEKAEDRLGSLLAHYSHLEYVVTRADIYAERWKYSTELRIAPIAGEIAPTCLTSLHGKIGHVNAIMLARQMHAERTKLDSVSHSIFRKEWSDDYLNLVTILSTVLSNKDGISDTLAKKIVSEITSKYFLARLRTSRLKNTPLKYLDAFLRGYIVRNLPYSLRILIYTFRLMKFNRVSSNYYRTFVCYMRSYIYLRNILCS